MNPYPKFLYEWWLSCAGGCVGAEAMMQDGAWGRWRGELVYRWYALGRWAFGWWWWVNE